MKTIRWMMVLEGEGDPAKVKAPFEVAAFARDYLRLHEKDRENFVVLILNTKNEIIAFETVTVGILNASLVHPREVFKPAIAASAASIIIVHNHPAGDPNPSDEDLLVTKRLMEAGAILGVPLKDHIIIGRDGYFSFQEGGKT